MKRIILLAVLGLATPALASDKPVALDDAALERVSGGTDSVPVANVTTNTNVSPIVVIQNAYAITYQNANTGNSAWGKHQGKGKKKGHEKNGKAANPFSTGNIAQYATTTAFNIATINYSVTQK